MSLTPAARDYCRHLLVSSAFGLGSMLLSACDKSSAENQPVLTIGAGGEIVEVDQIDALAPFDPALQQLVYHLSLEQTEEFIRRFPNSVVIDVRPPEQYLAGHLPGAKNADWLADLEVFQLLVGNLPKADKYLIYGSTAMLNDTGAAVALMRTIGFQNLHTFYASYDAWQSAGRPFEQGPDDHPIALPNPPSREVVEGVDDPELETAWVVWRRAEDMVSRRDAHLRVPDKNNKPDDAQPTAPPATTPGRSGSPPSKSPARGNYDPGVPTDNLTIP